MNPKRLSHPVKGIAGIGVELEGGWDCTLGDMAGEKPLAEFLYVPVPVALTQGRPSPTGRRTLGAHIGAPNRDNGYGRWCSTAVNDPLLCMHASCRHNYQAWSNRDYQGFRAFPADDPVAPSNRYGGQEPDADHPLFAVRKRCVCPRTYGHDGSVDVSGDHAPDYDSNGDITNPLHEGEIPSPVFRTHQELRPWLTDNYPDYVNESCGMHTHLSFHNLVDYERLMHPELAREVSRSLLSWADKIRLVQGRSTIPNWWMERMRNGNGYCTFDYHGPIQATSPSRDRRYTAVNFCLAEHGTMEFRILGPLPTADLAYGAIRHLVFTVQQQLWGTAKTTKVWAGTRFVLRPERMVNPNDVADTITDLHAPLGDVMTETHLMVDE